MIGANSFSQGAFLQTKDSLLKRNRVALCEISQFEEWLDPNAHAQHFFKMFLGFFFFHVFVCSFVCSAAVQLCILYFPKIVCSELAFVCIPPLIFQMGQLKETLSEEGQ